MKGRVAQVIVALPLLLAIAAAIAEKRNVFSQDSPVRWRTDFEAARAEAKAQNKPLFVCFR